MKMIEPERFMPKCASVLMQIRFSILVLSCNVEQDYVFHFFFFWFAGTNGLVIYGGVTEDGFTINPETGVISATQVLDRELQDQYTITGTSSQPVCSWEGSVP